VVVVRGLEAGMVPVNEADDGAQVGPLLDQVAGELASLTADGAYDQGSTYADVAQRHPDAAVVVPPRATAVPSETAESAPTQRDHHLQGIAEHGRMGWQKRSGYNTRGLSRDWGCGTGRRYFEAGFPVEVEATWPGS
jgi:hypothetical protein